MSELHPPEGPVNGGLLAGAPSEVPGKRQRRPSVRLGDIGDQPSTLSIEAYKRNRLWSDTKFRHYPQTGGVGGKSSKSRTLTNFGNGVDNHETLETEDGNLNRKGRDLKAKRGGTKRVRSNWVRKVDEGAERDEKLSSGEGGDEWYKGFDDAGEGSESPLKDQSLNESMENVGKDGFFPGQKRAARVRVSESRGDQGAVELDTDARDWNCRTSVDRDEGVRVRGSESREMCLEDGVRMWLNGLGLGRYEPVFEIHEVDEEVLPLLTLEDLKDMGINAVGSRRKLYSAIQKLGKGFS